MLVQLVFILEVQPVNIQLRQLEDVILGTRNLAHIVKRLRVGQPHVERKRMEQTHVILDVQVLRNGQELFIPVTRQMVVLEDIGEI